MWFPDEVARLIALAGRVHAGWRAIARLSLSPGGRATV